MIRIVKVTRGQAGFGFTITGGIDIDGGNCRVETVAPNGPAAKFDLHVSDLILRVNGQVRSPAHHPVLLEQLLGACINELTDFDICSLKIELIFDVSSIHRVTRKPRRIKCRQRLTRLSAPVSLRSVSGATLLECSSLLSSSRR